MKETPLRSNPELYQEIFGGAEFPEPQVRKLMAAVALISVKDYYLQPEAQKNAADRRRKAREQAEAKHDIFDRGAMKPGAVFSFDTICQALGIDPDYARRSILTRSPDEIKGIVRRLTFHPAGAAADDDND